MARRIFLSGLLRGLPLAAFVLAGTLSALPTRADDIVPPPWRGQPSTTMGIWEFDTPDPNPAPNGGFNPYGAPSTSITGSGWFPGQGAWSLGGIGDIAVLIPNNPVPNPVKDIWVQLTYQGSPVVSVDGGGATSTIETSDLGGGWWHSTYTMAVTPNPAFEVVHVKGPGTLVDEMVIDTYCRTPEPCSLALLGVGGVGAFVRRRRRRKA